MRTLQMFRKVAINGDLTLKLAFSSSTLASRGNANRGKNVAIYST